MPRSALSFKVAATSSLFGCRRVSEETRLTMKYISVFVARAILDFYSRTYW